MSTSVPFDAAARASDAATAAPIVVTDDTGTAARLGAWIVLLGTLVTTVGISWDIQWHNEVGPDTFFTLPHLFLYSGSAIAGFASLAMVLMATVAQRAGRPVPRAGGTPVRVFGGALTVPLGYMISGAGAAAFLLYGLLDLQWHSIYGFDAVLNTPAHVALFLSITLTMIGSLIVFAAHCDERWGRIGFVCALPILIAFAPIPFTALDNIDPPVDPMFCGTVLCGSLLLILGALVLARPGAALTIAVATGILQAALWWFSPWAAETYAAAIGLPLRDEVNREPAFPSMLPMFLIAAALVVEAVFRLARGRDLKWILLPTGVAVGVTIAVSMPLQYRLVFQSHVAVYDVLLLGVIAIPLGLLAGYLGGRFAVMLRALAPEEVR
ncbi:hypothetical protein NDR87_20130 [Nocardia sp. CDC159]|uniref:Uncharacterized protein n=1 Tax=Nocardia pulmonis TaxID=2951408 RepID=A0A9X2EAQ9_9NOCA|nr:MULTISPECIES: hypothetical protein [Nocardia]MCM6775995.1 hypothetical protein [Nocardia pulmonis]MCM6788678.1 hypothetical protein [Nocardia sp. CDC159]